MIVWCSAHVPCWLAGLGVLRCCPTISRDIQVFGGWTSVFDWNSQIRRSGWNSFECQAQILSPFLIRFLRSRLRLESQWLWATTPNWVIGPVSTRNLIQDLWKARGESLGKKGAIGDTGPICVNMGVSEKEVYPHKCHWMGKMITSQWIWGHHFQTNPSRFFVLRKKG